MYFVAQLLGLFLARLSTCLELVVLDPYQLLKCLYGLEQRCRVDNPSVNGILCITTQASTKWVGKIFTALYTPACMGIWVILVSMLIYNFHLKLLVIGFHPNRKLQFLSQTAHSRIWSKLILNTSSELSSVHLPLVTVSIYPISACILRLIVVQSINLQMNLYFVLQKTGPEQFFLV